MASENNNSPHILSASSNLLGLCFVVLTSLRALNLHKATLVDECITVAILLFTFSCILSFMSIRKFSKFPTHYERVADYIFLVGLLVLLVTTLLIASETI